MRSIRYAHLAPVYDELFPLDPDALSLVVSLLARHPEPCLVDAGCGTGLLVRAVADAGYRAHGFDLDPDLLALARRREGGLASFMAGDLRAMSLPEGLPSPRLVTCLGNTLPHLLSEDDVSGFLRQVSRALSPGGELLLQVLDYDFLRRQNQLTLPVRESETWKFRRWYEIQPSGLWRFHTILEGAGGQSTGAFDLRPWGCSELKQSLASAGFEVQSVWGGFDQGSPGSSLPLVLLARVV